MGSWMIPLGPAPTQFFVPSALKSKLVENSLIVIVFCQVIPSEDLPGPSEYLIYSMQRNARYIVQYIGHFKTAKLRAFCSLASSRKTSLVKGHETPLCINYNTPATGIIATEFLWDEDDSLNILDSIESGRQKKWGLSILRCTYTSQPRWEKYISIIQRNIQECIRHDLLRESLDCPIIEDIDRLDRATWKQARTAFDAWALDEIAANPVDYSNHSIPVPTNSIERLESEVRSTPRWEYFIYADKASVDSVVDCTAQFPLISEGDYWITIVSTGLVRPRQSHENDDGVWVRDEEGDLESQWGTWKGLYQRIKVMELVAAYDDMITGDLTRLIVGDDGISQVH